MAGFKATFPSVRASLVQAREQVRVFAREMGFPELEVFDIVMAVGEACSNVVLHAATDKGFWVACDYNHGVLTVQVHDFGSGFSLDGSGRFIEPHERKSGGLGVSIMRVLMDKVTYEMTEGGTTITLVKQASADSRAEPGKKNNSDCNQATRSDHGG